MVSISVGTSKIRSDTGASCRFSPLTWVVRRSAPEMLTRRREELLRVLAAYDEALG
jgi:hypothetical protein